MSRRAPVLRIAILVLLSLMVTGFQCVSPLWFLEGDSDQPADEQPNPQENFIGGNDERLVFSRFDGLVRVYDMAAGSNTPLPVFSFPTSDGDWLVVLDNVNCHDEDNYTYCDRAVRATNLKTGKDDEFIVPPGLGYLYPEQVAGSRVYVSGYFGSAGLLEFLDLSTGKWTLLLDNLGGSSGYFFGIYSFGADAEWLAIWYQLPLTVPDSTSLVDPTDPAFSDQLTTQIDVINLATNERRSIVSNLSRADVDHLTVLNDKVYWHQTDYDDASLPTSSAIWVHDLVSHETQKVMNLPDDVWVSAIGKPGVLTVRSLWPEAPAYDNTNSELRTFQGDTQEILNCQSQVTPLDCGVRIAGNSLVFQGEVSGEWIVYDPGNGERRTIRPFEADDSTQE